MTLWVYQQITNGEVKRLSRRIVSRFFDFTGTIQPHSDDEFIRLALCTIEIQDRKPIALLGEHFSKYRVSAEGMLDGDHWMDAKRVAIAKLDISLPRLFDDDVDDGKIVGQRQMTHRRDQTLHCWIPTNEDLLALGHDLIARGLPRECLSK